MFVAVVDKQYVWTLLIDKTGGVSLINMTIIVTSFMLLTGLSVVILIVFSQLKICKSELMYLHGMPYVFAPTE